MLKLKDNPILLKLKSGLVQAMGANAINQAVGMLSTMLITRIMTKSDYGIWGYALNIYSYLLLITGFGLISGAMQYGTENSGTSKAFAYYKYCLKNGFVIDVIIVFVTGIIFSLKKIPIAEAKPFIIAILPYLLLEFLISIGQTILRSQNKIGEYSHTLNFNSIVIAVGTCGGAFFGVKGTLLGRYIADVLSVLFVSRYLKNDISKIYKADQIVSEEKRKLWKYSSFTGISAALNCLVYLVDVTLVAELIMDAEEVATYKFATLIPNALQFIPSSVVVALLPTIIYHRDDIGWLKKLLKKTYLGLVLGNLSVCFLLYVLIPVIVLLISGSNYFDAIPILRVLLIGYFFSGTFRTFSVNFLAAFHRIYYGLFISVTSCLADIVFNYFFIIKFGSIGAAYATLLVDIITAVLSFLYVIYLLKKEVINEY